MQDGTIGCTPVAFPCVGIFPGLLFRDTKFDQIAQSGLDPFSAFYHSAFHIKQMAFHQRKKTLSSNEAQNRKAIGKNFVIYMSKKLG